MILDYNDSEEEFIEELLDDFIDPIVIPSVTKNSHFNDKMLIQKYLETNSITICKPSGSLEQTIKVSDMGSNGIFGLNKW